jgi:hypothetical protein
MNLLNEFEIKCDFSANGCQLYIKLCELENHKSKCVFNPESRLICVCGFKCSEEELLNHQNNCVYNLREEIIALKKEKNALKEKVNQINDELITAKQEISLRSEWNRLKEIEIIETNMPYIMKGRVMQFIINSLNEEVFDDSVLLQRICYEFGGNWNLFIGHQLVDRVFERTNYLRFKIGKFKGFLYMNVKPAHDILVLEKALKIIQFSIENNCNSDDLKNAWTMIFCLTDDSFNLSERFLDKNGLNYFMHCFNLFSSDNVRLFFPMVGVLANITEIPTLRYHLMSREYIEAIIKLMSKQCFSLNFFCAFVLANILSEGNRFWNKYLKNDLEFNRNAILAEFKSRITEWKLNDRLETEFTTFKPFKRLIKKKEKPSNQFKRFMRCDYEVLNPIKQFFHLDEEIPQEVKYFAVWALAHSTKRNCEKYCKLLEEDNCITVLEDLINDRKTDDSVRSLVNIVLNQNQMFLKNRT